MKGLLKASFEDPNPVVILEHKGLYWSKIPGTESAKVIEPDRDYRVPLGKRAPDRRRRRLAGRPQHGHHRDLRTRRALGTRSRPLPGRVELLDLRTIQPVDYDAIEASIARTNRRWC